MKKLDTSAITINSWMPLLANNPAGISGIDFLQQAYIECLRALAGFLVADSTKATIMYGCNVSSWTSSFTDTTLVTNPGWVFFNGELYYFPGGTLIYPNAEVCVNANIDTTHYSAADPTTFSDGSTHNVHQQRQITLSASATQGSGNAPDFTLWQTITNNSSATPAATAVLNAWLTSTYNGFVSTFNAWAGSQIPFPIQVGVGTAPRFQNGWVNDTGVTGQGIANPLMFYRLFDRVYIWGEVCWGEIHTVKISNSAIFTLPAGYLPYASEEVFRVPDTTALTPTGGYDGSPNIYNIWITDDGTVNFLGAPLVGQFSISLSGINFKVAPPILEE